jgi:preprotein translocase subunit SecY
MASAAEQLAANINFASFGKNEELQKRIWFTLGALLVYRLGAYVPIPGIDQDALSRFANAQSTGILGWMNAMAGGALGRLAIFALGIMPYISSSIIMQLMTSVSPQLEALKKEGESGRKKINQYTRYGTVLIAALQAYGIASGAIAQGFVSNPDWFFRASAVITLTGGTVFLMWLGEQITSRGIGNGTSLIIFSGIVANLPNGVAALLEMGRKGLMSPFLLVAILAGAIGVVAFIVFFERAQRRLLIQYPKRQIGMKVTQGESSHLPLKLNTSGVIPPIFASALLTMPLTVATFYQGKGPDWLNQVTAVLGHGKPLFLALYAGLIIFFCFFYTSIMFNPKDTAENLKKSGGFILGIRPGDQTADYFDRILTRITVLGAAYMVIVCLIPEVFANVTGLALYFGGTSIMIVVSVTMDTVSQLQGHLLSQQYERLMKKSTLRNRLK